MVTERSGARGKELRRSQSISTSIVAPAPKILSSSCVVNRERVHSMQGAQLVERASIDAAHERSTMGGYFNAHFRIVNKCVEMLFALARVSC